MKSTRSLLGGVLVLQAGELAFNGQPCDVLIEGKVISGIAPTGQLDRGSVEQVFELPGHLVVPGLINGHQHSHEHFQRGRTENLPLELWQHMVRGKRPVKLTPRQAYLRTMVGAIESLRTGCTTLVDDLSLGTSVDEEVVQAALQAYEDSGIRALVGFAMMDKPMIDNFPFVDELVPKELLSDLRSAPKPDPDAFVSLIKRLTPNYHPQEKRVGVLVSASAPQRCTEAFLRRLRGVADDLALPVITHVQETRLQVVTGLQFFGSPMVEYLARIGFLKQATSLIHAVWLNPREMALMAEHGATAQHNPWSNLLLGSGVQPVRELLDAGVNVSLGSDGSCSTVTTSMLQTVGSAAALSKIRSTDHTSWLSAKEAWHAGTEGGAKALGFGERLGTLKKGSLADLVAYRLDTVTFTPLNDPLKQLVYSERGAGISFSMVGGEVTMLDGRLTQINESKILAEISDEFHELSSKYSSSESDALPVIQAMEKIYERSLQIAVPNDTFAARISPLNPR